MVKPGSRVMQTIPVNIAGSTRFGRYPKINSEQTINLVVVDDFLVNYAGFKNAHTIAGAVEGRGIFTSTRLGKMIVVVDNKAYTATSYLQNNNRLSFSYIGNLQSYSGNISMAENNGDQIAICDEHYLYIYDYNVGSFTQAVLPDGFIPSFVTFQDGYFIITNSNGSTFALSALNNGLNWFWGSSANPVIGTIATKPDLAMGAIRVPGHGNLLFVFGKTVGEMWSDVGGQIFPYQRATTINLDYGLLNQATLAAQDNFVAWVGVNEQSGPVIMYSEGNGVKQFPNDDGINYRLSLLQNPTKCSAFFIRLAGRLFYQVTWYDPKDNLSLVFDFITQKFYTVTRENGNFHIARKVAFYNNTYYFVSFIDGNIYEMSPELTTYDYGLGALGNPQVYEIPRIRICNTVRVPGPQRKVVNLLEFTMEQGTDSKDHNLQGYQPRIDLSISRDGGETFGTPRPYIVNPIGKRMNRINWFGLGAQNEFTPQIRFWGFDRFVASGGYVGVYG